MPGDKWMTIGSHFGPGRGIPAQGLSLPCRFALNGAMLRTRVPPWISLIAIALIALASVMSAAMMAPDRGTADRLTTSLVFGLSDQDICMDGSGGHADHHCPFCRLLSDPPDARPARIAGLLHPFDGWRQGADRNRRAQAQNLRHAPRAPPHLA